MTAVWNLLQGGVEIVKMLQAAVGEGKRETVDRGRTVEIEIDIVM
jgi:hypothetical protein